MHWLQEHENMTHLGKVTHEGCPKCTAWGKDTSQDNLARYEDGHAYCFSCKYYEGPKAHNIVRQLNLSEERQKKLVRLPDDASRTIPAKVMEWMAQFDIGRTEIIHYDFRWSDHWQSLIFPIYSGTKELLAFQARSFAPESGWKYFNKGDIREIIHPLNYQSVKLTTTSNYGIVLVEDYISAIKLARQTCSLCLFGSNANSKLMHRLKLLTDCVILWLDSDKFAEAITGANAATQFGMRAKVVFTTKDPKEYSDEEIKNTLGL